MASQETGKQRAARIPLDYYKKPDRLAAWKLRFTLLAVILTGLYLGMALLPARDVEARYSHGPVHTVHQAFENRCDVCHASFQPIKQDVWLTSFMGKPSADERCETCHAGPSHHDSQRAGDVVSCGSCHRDHRGREVSLVNLPDSDCTSCHRDLKNHIDSGKPPYENVTVFSVPGGHPEFALQRDKKPDPGKLKFNHDLHLRPGQTLVSGGKQWTLDDIKDPSERERYLRAQPKGEGTHKGSAPVQLQCASCHLLDGKEAGRGPGGSGEYMLPTTYDNHCKACHPLTFDAKKPGQTIPHHLQPDQVHAFLWGSVAEEKIKDPDLRKRLTATLPLPGKLLPEEEIAREDVAKTTTGLETFLYKDKVEDTERYLYSGKTTCGECHHYEAGAPPDKPRKIVPTQVPEVWLTHAKFSHLSHRAVTCRECHPAAYPDATGKASTSSADVMIPGIGKCVTCHAPASTVAGQAQGGVRFNCTVCHRYHNGDHALKGLGASERGAKQRRSTTDLLRE
jgi:hypothetical protein